MPRKLGTLTGLLAGKDAGMTTKQGAKKAPPTLVDKKKCKKKKKKK